MEIESASAAQYSYLVSQPVFLAELLVFVILMLLAAFFAASEVALIALSAHDKTNLVENEDAISKRVLHLIEEPGETLIVILSLNTLTNVSIGVLGALLTNQIATAYHFSHAIAFVIEVVVLTFLLLIISETTPKMIAQSRALAFSRFAATPLYLIFKLLHPFARWFAGLSTQLNNRMRPISSGLSSDDLKYLADLGIQHGTLQEEEHGMIHSIAEFGETTVREIMVSRMDMIAIADTASLSDVFNVVREYSYSRYPVYQESLDDIIGLIYAKDLLPLIEKEATNPDTPWLNLCRTDVLYVPETKKIDDLLDEFQLKKTHVAIVTDENSGTEGLVTMEDILEEIVGEIHDETDDDEENQFIQKMDTNTYIINARINLDDLSEALNLSLEWEEDSFDTLAGLILHINEDIPKKGEVILYENLKMTVQSLENHRIEKVLMEILV